MLASLTDCFMPPFNLDGDAKILIPRLKDYPWLRFWIKSVVLRYHVDPPDIVIAANWYEKTVLNREQGDASKCVGNEVSYGHRCCRSLLMDWKQRGDLWWANLAGKIVRVCLRDFNTRRGHYSVNFCGQSQFYFVSKIIVAMTIFATITEQSKHWN